MAIERRVAIDLIIEKDGCTIAPKKIEGFDKNTDEENAELFHLLSCYLERTAEQYKEKAEKKWRKRYE